MPTPQWYRWGRSFCRIFSLKRLNFEEWGELSKASWLQRAEAKLDWTKSFQGVFSKLVAAKLLQSCPTLCDPMDCSLSGSPVPGILQAKTLEWVALSFSNAWKWKAKVKSLSRVRLLATPWTAAYQAPPSMGFSGQQYWSGVPLPSPSTSVSHPKFCELTYVTEAAHSTAQLIN